MDGIAPFWVFSRNGASVVVHFYAAAAHPCLPKVPHAGRIVRIDLHGIGYGSSPTIKAALKDLAKVTTATPMNLCG